MGAKDRGNRLVEAKAFSRACEVYAEALELIKGCADGSGAELRAAGDLRTSCLLNLTHCSMKLEDFAVASKYADDVLKLDPRCCKALFRRGICNMSRGNLEDSKADLLEASRIDPRNAQVREKLEECRRRLAEERCRRTAWNGMFGKAPDQQVVAHDLDRLIKVWMDVQIGTAERRRVTFALYNDTMPRTSYNFRALCTGEKGLGRCGQPLHFRQTLVHRVVAGSLVEAGDIENYDGTGGESIYGPCFEDEGFETHHKRGILSMCNRGPDTNDSKFFVSLRSLSHLDGKHVVFGEVFSGMYVLDAIESLETTSEKPKLQVAIVDCGAEAGWDLAQ